MSPREIPRDYIIALQVDPAANGREQRPASRARLPMIECIPNVSEGRHPEVVAALAATLSVAPGVTLLDVSSDPSHNRSVFTAVGSQAGLETAAVALVQHAIQVIDLRHHDGVHPRMGAVDVLPFVPLGKTTTATCVELAEQVGARIGEQLDIPVFLYGDAARSPARRKLEDIRRGQFEGLADKLATGDWMPDFGPPRRHPTAGAVAVGVRRLLVAFNVNLRSDSLAVARRVAAAVRERSGGLPGVKALGFRLPHRGLVQVSMNLTDLDRTTLQQAFDRVSAEAAADGVTVLESEIVGLVPRAALRDTTPARLQLARGSRGSVLEDRIEAAAITL